MSTRVIVLFPSFEDPGPIHRYRKRWDPLAELVPPHVTLVFPFTSELPTEPLRAHVEQVCAQVSPFVLQLRGVTASEGEYLFLNVKQGNDEVIRLHDLLYTGPLQEHLRLDHTFVPHLTVGRVPDADQIDVALAEAGPLRQSFEMTIYEVTVYSIAADGERRVDSSVPLG